MITILCAAMLVGGDEENRPAPQSSLTRELAGHAVKLSRAKGLPQRMEELAAVVSRLTEAMAAAALSKDRTEESIVLAKLILVLVDDGLVARLREATDDESKNDKSYASAADSASRACDQIRSLLVSLPEDQRARVQPKLDTTGPKVVKLVEWVTKRIERHDKASNPGGSE